MNERRGKSTGSGRWFDRGDGRNGLRRRRYLKTAGGAASLTVAGCLKQVGSIAGANADPIVIGVLAPDPDSNFIGRSLVRGAKVAVDELDDNGGIRGRKVELVVGDTNGSPLEARRQYQRLILEEGADVTVGIFASEVLMNVMDDIAEQRTVHLTSGAATTAASRLVKDQYENYKYHFRVGPNNNYDLGRLQIDFMEGIAPTAGWESVAVLAEDYDWAQRPWEVYQDQLADTGLDIVMERLYPPATDDFSAIYEAAADAGADVAFTTMAHTGTAALLDWAYPNRPERPPRPQPFAFAGIHVPMQLPGYYDMVNGACRYAVGQSSATAKSTRAETKSFVQRYRDTYDGDVPVYTGYHSYDAVQMFAQAVEDTGTLESDELVEILEGMTFTGSTGTVEFYDRDHEYPHDLKYDPDSPDSVYFQWQEDDDGQGAQEIIWPESRATADYVSPPWL